jgi:FkbM family methyltransferase
MMKVAVRVIGLILMGLGGALIVFLVLARGEISHLASFVPNPVSEQQAKSNPPKKVPTTAALLAPFCTEEQTKYAPVYQRKENLRAAEIVEASTLLRNEGTQEVWDTPHGRFWIIPGELPTLADVLAEEDYHVYEENGEGVRKGDVVLDCGAHYGAYTKKALKMGAKLVVAIELAPDNVACLRKTFAEEIGAGRVVVYPKGVWDKDDELVMQRRGSSAGNSVAIGSDSQGDRVPLTTIDALVRELKLPRVDFIKMDIEGAETRAVAGATETIRKHRPRLALSAYHVPNDPLNLLVKVRDLLPTYWASFGSCKYYMGRFVPVILFFH